MENQLKMSLVMATFNRAETIKRTLKYIAEQDISPELVEIIVVDDGSKDDTKAAVEEASKEMPFPLSFLSHENRGPGYTQNRGIENATGDILMLMADDIWMEPQTLRRHYEFHTRHSEITSARLGSVFQSSELIQTVYLRNWDPHNFESLKGIEELPFYMFWACNVSLKRKFMLEHGMFRDPKGRAGPAAHEDPEVGYRLMKAGMRLFYDEQAKGYHYHLEDFDITLDRMYQRGLNFGQFRTLVPEPEVVVAYHVWNLGTIVDHIKTFSSNERKQNLIPHDRILLRLLMHYLIRGIVFNFLTIKFVWLPFLRAAETNKMLENLVHPKFYHGVLAYYFHRGCADGNRIFVHSKNNIEPT